MSLKRIHTDGASATIAWRWWTLALSVALADQLLKLAVSMQMPYGHSIPLTSFFNLVHLRNTGAAFSFLAEAGGWQRYFFIILTLGVSTGLMYILRQPRRRLEAFAFSLVLGGAVGNGVDRIVRGFVVDYLDFYWQRWHWPAFNLADTGIVLGVCFLVISIFNKDKQLEVEP